MRKQVRIPIFYQHLFIYIILLIVPLFIIGYIIHFQLLTSLKSQVTESNEQKLTQMKDIMDTKLLELHNISMQISNQPELTPYSINNFYDVFKAKKLLNYKAGNDFIYDLFYFIRDGDYLYSEDSSYSIPLFIESHYQYKHWQKDDFYQKINTSEERFLRNAEDITLFNGVPSRMITYGVPVPLNNSNPYGTILFLIKEKTIRDMLRNVIHTAEGNALILDENNQMVASLTPNDKELALINKEIEKKGVEGIRSLNIGDRSYFMSYIKSEFLDWTYITFVPEEELMKEVNAVRNKVLTSYMIILGVGGMLIYLGIHMNYKPLRRLIRRADEKWARVVNHRHELDKIWGAMDYTDSINQKLSEQVENSLPVLQQHLLIRLLRGEMIDHTEFNILGAEIDLTLKNFSYFVMLVDFNKEEMPPLHKRAQLVESWLSQLPNIEKHRVDLFETSKIALILSGEVDASLLVNWYQKYVKSQSSTITIGVGNSYHDFTQIGKSHLEASTALHYKLIKGADQIIFFTETLAQHPSLRWYDKRMMEQLELFLRQKDKERVDEVIDQIVHIIKSEDTNLFMAKCLSFDVSSTVMRIVHDMRSFQKEVGGTLPDVFLINDFHSVEEIEETVRSMIQAAFRLDDQTAPEQKLLDELLDYMKRNYYDYEFSIQSLAEQFGLSETYIMRYFKKQTGDTILQHLNRLRLDHTKQLLETTDLPIKEIVTQVGYSDVSSFIRRFKQSTQLTPGEYRKRYARKKA